MSKKNRRGGVIWATHKPVEGYFPPGSHYIRVTPDGRIQIIESSCFGPVTKDMSRMNARLLARRILQALEETK